MVNELKIIKEDIKRLQDLVDRKIGEQGGDLTKGNLFVHRGMQLEEAVNVSQLKELDKKAEKSDSNLQSQIDSIIPKLKLGASSTTGNPTDWNDPSNCKDGFGDMLLLGTATNGFGEATYFHIMNFEYQKNNGSGNLTQIAIPYASATSTPIHYRSRYGGVWTAWMKITAVEV